MPTINDYKKKALNDAGYSGDINKAEWKWLKAICEPYVGTIPDMWRYALNQAGFSGSLPVAQSAMLKDLGYNDFSISNKWYKYWRDTPLTGIGGILAIGADLALWFDENQAYKSSGGGIVTPDSILTYTAPSPKLVYGSDGVLGYAPHNLLAWSDDFRNTADAGSTRPWTYTNGTGGITVTPDALATESLDKIVLANGVAGYVGFGSGATVLNGSIYTFSLVVAAAEYSYIFLGGDLSSGRIAAASVFNLNNGTVQSTSSGTAAIQSLGGGLYRCSVTGLSSATTAQPFFRPYSNATTAATGNGVNGIYVGRAQLNVGSSALTYIPTTTAAVYSLPRDYNPTTGAALGVLVEEQRTNLCLYSDDFTNVAWVKVNVTAAKTATGPDGVANSASTLTATLANGTVLQTITSASAGRVTSMFVKRRTGTGAIEMTQNNGVLWTAVTVTANWTRVSVPSATILNPIVGVRIVTSGDEIDVALFQIENGAFITSPIPTVASQVTRAADNISILTSAFPYSATAGTVAYEVKPAAVSFPFAYEFSDGTAGERILSNAGAAAHLAVTDGGVTQADIDAGTITAGVFNKAAQAFSANDFAAVIAGGTVGTDTSGTMPTVTTLRLGYQFNSVNFLNGHIKRLAYYNTRKTNAELQVLST